MSQPALEVTGSQEVGSSHSQFSVPDAPVVLAVEPDPAAAELEALLPQAASARIATAPAAAAMMR
jgi:hypothetical protein